MLAAHQCDVAGGFASPDMVADNLVHLAHRISRSWADTVLDPVIAANFQARSGIYQFTHAKAKLQVETFSSGL